MPNVLSLTNETITNYYLYGQLTKPPLDSERLIRDANEAVEPVSVDLAEFMQNGAGRFALAATFEIVRKFFVEGENLPPGIYYPSEIGAYFNHPDLGLNIKQYELDDGAGDYLERVYIWNQTAFQLAPTTTFVVGSDGTRWIDGLAVLPVGQENFDFVGSNRAINFVQGLVLEPNIDPSGIGRTVPIDFHGTIPTRPYSHSDFLGEMAVSAGWESYAWVQLPLVAPVIADLFASGATNFMHDGLVVRYLTHGDDQEAKASFFENPLNNIFHSPLAKMGQIVYFGDGNDDFTLDYGFDSAEFRLFGGSGLDAVYSEGGASSFYTIQLSGIEEFHGGEGDDTIEVTDLDYDGAGLYLMLGNGSNYVNMNTGDWGATLIVLGGNDSDFLAVGAHDTGAFDGGDGHDVLSFGNLTEGVDITLNGSGSMVGALTVMNVETVILTEFDDVVVSDGVSVIGGGGADTITILDEDTFVFGGEGDDTIHAPDGAANVYGGDGQDRLFVDGAIDPFFGYLDFEEVNATDDVDHVVYFDPEQSVWTFAGNDRVLIASNTGGQTFRVDGGDGYDTVTFTPAHSHQSEFAGITLYAVGVEAVLDGYRNESIGWIQSAAQHFDHQSYDGHDVYSWVYEESSTVQWRLTVRVRPADQDGVRSASIDYGVSLDVSLEADSPGYGLTIFVDAFQSGDFGISAGGGALAATSEPDAWDELTLFPSAYGQRHNDSGAMEPEATRSSEFSPGLEEWGSGLQHALPQLGGQGDAPAMIVELASTDATGTWYAPEFVDRLSLSGPVHWAAEADRGWLM